jgi:hypothetical protein
VLLSAKWTSGRFSINLVHAPSLIEPRSMRMTSCCSSDLNLKIFSSCRPRCFRGLRHNPSKCEMAPIRCAEGDIQLATNIFPCQLVDFPIKYLGIPLALGKLPKSALQPSWPLRFIKFPFNKHFPLPAT